MKGLMFIKKVTILSMISLVLIGCWDANEMEQLHYIHTAGIDYVDGDYHIYANITNFIGGQEESGGGSEDTPAIVGVGKGKTVVEAVHDLYTYTHRKIYFGHLATVVLSTDVLENGVIEALEAIDRFNEIGGTFWIYGTSEPLQEILTQHPILDLPILFSIFGDPMDTYRQSSIVAPLKINDFRRNLFEPGQTVHLPNLAISKKRWLTEEDYFSNVGTNGAHFIQENAYKGVLTGGDIMGLRWVQEQTERAPLKIKTDDKHAVSVIVTDPDINRSISLKQEEPQFNLEVSVKVNVIEVHENLSEESIKQEVEKSIEKQIRTLYNKGLNMDADVLQLSYHFYREHPRLWNRISEEANGQLVLNEESLDDINVNVQIKHSHENKMRKK